MLSHIAASTVNHKNVCNLLKNEGFMRILIIHRNVIVDGRRRDWCLLYKSGLAEILIS
jgi:hypothetical protein